MSEPGGTLRGSALDLEPMISYAGNQEDVRLRRIAHLLLSKVYVDVGAGDPVEGSVTYWLYTQGWRGVLVEPGARGAQLAAARPEDVVLTVAVSSGGGDVLLYETAPDPGMSTMRADRLAEVLDLGQTVTQVRVPVVTLTEVFEGAPGPVSVLSLDVEGAEGIVLGSLDWATHRPVVVVVEAVLPWSTVSTAHDFEGHLTGAAYDRVAFDGVNTYYVDSRHELAGELASALDYPTSILDRWRSAAMDRLEHYATSMTDQVAALTTQLDAVTADLASARGRAEAQDREPPGLRGSQREAAQRLGRERNRVEELTRQLDQARSAGARAEAAEAQLRRQLDEVLGSSTWRYVAPAAHALRRPARVLRALPRPADAVGAARQQVQERRAHARLRRAGPAGRVELAVVQHTHPAFLETPPSLDCSPPGAPSWRALAATSARDDDDTLQDRVNRREPVRDDVGRSVLLAAVAEAVLERGSKSPGRRGSSRDTVVLDARSLQDRSLSTRGVGHYARELLRDLLELGLPVVLLVDPTLPALDGEAADVAFVHAVTDDLVRRTRWLVQPSPMTHDQWPLTALLDDAGVWSSTVVYDFIPSSFPDVYLPEPAARLVHAARAQALGLYDEALAISQVTLDQLEQLTGRPAQASVTWPSLDHPAPALASALDRPLPERYVLVGAGREHRKNIVGALGMVALLRLDDPSLEAVVLGWSGGPEELHTWADAVELPHSALHVMPFLPDEQAAAVRREALLGVVPSFAEGLSLPVIEIVRAGCPVVASAIPPHRELLGEGPWLGDPAVPASLAQAARAVLTDRAGCLARQQASLEGHPHTTVKLALQHRHRELESRVPAARTTRAGRPRLGIVTPWPPQRSGVADYSRSTLLPLAAKVQLTLGLSPGAVHDTSTGVARCRAGVAALELADQDDLLVVMGNSHFHLPGLEVLQARGGVALCHDVRLTELNSYVGLTDHPDRLPAADPPRRRTLRHDLDALPTLGFDHVAEHARLLLFHSRAAAERVAAETGAQTGALPFVPYRVPTADERLPESRRRQRQRLGMSDTEVHLGLLGGVDVRTKAADVVVEAQAWLRQWGHDVVLHVAGAVSPVEQDVLHQLAVRAGIADRLRWHGHVSDSGYRDLLLALDLGVQLRSAALLTLSGAAADLSAFGVPSVANTALVQEMELPGFVRPVPDDFSPLLVAEALEALVLDPPSPANVEQQRQDYLTGHSVTAYGTELLRLTGLGA